MGTRPRVANVSVKRAAAKRVAGKRTAKTMVVRQVVGAETESASPEAPLRPAQCRAHMRRVLAEEFRDIVKGFVEGAKSGSCQHVKLATEFLDGRKKEPVRRSGSKTLKRLIHRMQQIEE